MNKGIVDFRVAICDLAEEDHPPNQSQTANRKSKIKRTGFLAAETRGPAVMAVSSSASWRNDELERLNRFAQSQIANLKSKIP